MKKVLMVVGASSEMGMASIEALHERYDYIIAHYFHMSERLQRLKEVLGKKIYCINADLSEETQIEKFIRDTSATGLIPTHILHFPAHQIKIQKFHKISVETFEKSYSISVKSLIQILQYYLPKMTKNRGGKVLIILSYVLQGMPPKYSADYVITKYSLLGLVKSLAVEYADKNITVNGISPGCTETKFIKEMNEYIIEENAKASPIGRNLKVDDIVPTIEYMLSDGANYINGENIFITCGRG